MVNLELFVKFVAFTELIKRLLQLRARYDGDFARIHQSLEDVHVLGLQTKMILIVN